MKKPVILYRHSSWFKKEYAVIVPKTILLPRIFSSASRNKDWKTLEEDKEICINSFDPSLYNLLSISSDDLELFSGKIENPLNILVSLCFLGDSKEQLSLVAYVPDKIDSDKVELIYQDNFGRFVRWYDRKNILVDLGNLNKVELGETTVPKSDYHFYYGNWFIKTNIINQAKNKLKELKIC